MVFCARDGDQNLSYARQVLCLAWILPNQVGLEVTLAGFAGMHHQAQCMFAYEFVVVV